MPFIFYIFQFHLKFMNFNGILNYIIKSCFKSIVFMELYLNFNEIMMKFLNQTALFLAVEKENIEIIKLLLMDETINLNIPYIFY